MKKYQVCVDGLDDQIIEANSVLNSSQGVAFFIKDQPEAIAIFFSPHVIAVLLAK